MITIEDLIINWLNENYNTKKYTTKKINDNLIGIFKKDSLELIKVISEYSIKQKLKKEKYWK